MILQGIVQKINKQYELGKLEKDILSLITQVLSTGFIQKDQLADLQNMLYLLDKQERKNEHSPEWTDDVHSECCDKDDDEISEESISYQRRLKTTEKENKSLFWQTFIYRQNEIGCCMLYLHRLQKEPNKKNKKGIERRIVQ